MAHMGLYAYAYTHYGLQCPVYATLPVQAMGRLQMLDIVRGWSNEVDRTSEASTRCLPTEAQVDEAFEAIRTVRYLQPTPLEGKCAGLVLTAYNAGHTLGGTVWKLRSPSVGTLVMALDWNHHRERHLDGTALVSVGAAAPLAHTVGRPDVFITGVERGQRTNARRKDRDAALLEQVHRTLTGGHSVLIPVDSAARMLEVLVLLDQHWAYAYQHQRFPLCLVSHTGQEVVERARTFMEWMSREWAIQLLDASDKQRARRTKSQALTKSPLDFPGVRYFTSVEALHQALSASQVKVVLATPAAITHGLARQLLPDFLCDPDALLAMIDCGPRGSLLRTLFDRWNATQSDPLAWRTGHIGTAATLGGTITYEMRRRVPLAGDELRAYHERKQAEAQAQAQRVKVAPRQREADADEMDDEEDGSSSDSSMDEDNDGELLAHRRLMSTRDIAPDAMNTKESTEISFDIYLRGHASRDAGQHYRMFPAAERKRRVDGYGEAIDTARWLARRRRLEAEQEEQLDPERFRRAAAQQARTKAQATAPSEVPSKYTTDTLHAAVRCRAIYVDLQGLYDGRALTTLIPQLQPRRVILVNGDATTFAEMRTTLSKYELYMPSLGETVTVGGLVDSYSVRLGDTLMSQLRWRQMEEYQVVHVHVAPDFAGDADTPTLMPVHDAATLHAAQAPSTLYVGDLRLSALKAYLAREHRIRADFAGEGVMICTDKQGDRPVRVAKQADGRIVIEGNVSMNLVRVRQAIYHLVAQVNQ
ncbi:mRNA polyadenylation protein [Malassezia pachydermatis]